MKVYRLEIEEDTKVGRTLRVDVGGSCKLHELHEMISLELELEQGRPYSFFRSGRRWDSRTEFGGPGAGAEQQAKRTRMDRLALRPGACMAHVHGLDEPAWHEIRVLDVREDEIGETPPWKVLERLRARPEREDPELTELADALADILGERLDELPEGDRSDQARRHHELALRVLAWVGEDQGRLQRLDEISAWNVREWLFELPFELARHGLPLEGADLAARSAELIDPAVLLADRAEILAGCGQREEAIAQAEQALARFPDDSWVAVKAGDVHEECGDPVRAEALFRRGLALSGDDASERDGALERLLPLLEGQGREEEARALAEEEEAARGTGGDLAEELDAGEWTPFDGEPVEEDELDRGDVLIPAGPQQRRVGRNDPCPCGSGRKFKRCCGARTAEPEVSELDLSHELVSRVVAFALRAGDGAQARAAASLFGGQEFDDIPPEEALPLLPSADCGDVFLAWLVLDRRPPGGGTFTESFLAKRGRKLDSRERAVLERVSGSHLGLYRLEGWSGEREDSCIRLRDLVSQEELPLAPSAAVVPLETDTTFLGRIVDLDGVPRLLSPCLIVADDQVESLVAAARCGFERLAEQQHPGAARSGLEKAHGHLLTRLWLDSAVAEGPSVLRG